VATDFSAASVGAIDRAVALANQCQAALTILHVIDVNTPSDCGPAEEAMKHLWTQRSLQMGQLAGSLSGQVDAQTMLEEGLPWQSIVANSRHHDLVIIGKGSPKSGWQVFSKHTLERVIEQSACPVLVVQQAE
jgi:nucleotide-binding universal stress UspA family protein